MHATPDANLPRSFEDLYVAFYRRACRDAPDVEQHEDEDLYWVLTGIPLSMPNAVVRTHWRDEPPERIRELVATTLRPFQMRQVPTRWYIWPSSSPAELGDHLVTAGLAHGDDSPLMARELTLPLAPAPLPSGVRVERVDDPETFAHWVSVAVGGFEFGETHREAALFRTLGYDEGVRQYLAWLDGEPVAVATLFLADERAGIFNVATLPEARGRGIGSAITARCLQDARDAACRYALLSSSAMGLPVYQRLGFETVAMLEHYGWRPGPTAK